MKEEKTSTSNQVDEQYIQWQLEKKRRLRIITIILPALLGMGMLLFRVINPDFFSYSFERNFISMMILFSFAVSAIGIIMLYLQTGFKKISRQEADFSVYKKELDNMRSTLEKSNRTDKEKVDQLQKDLEGLRDTINKQTVLTDFMSEEQKKELLDNFEARFIEDASSAVLEDLKTKVATSLEKSSTINEINNQFSQTNARLSRELSSLGRRGNLNLSLGIVTTVAGLIVLSYFVITYSHPADNALGFVTYFVPRISLIIFIELFAYFFLRLYKSSLSEIKYFQNEMTNIEAKQVALVVSFGLAEKKVCEHVITTLSNTERNYILNKGQTTIDLEKAKLDKEAVSSFIDKLTNFLKRAKD